MVLFPNETWKAYVGVGRQGQFTYLKQDGSAGGGINPDTRDIFIAALGRAISPRVFATVALPVVRNAIGDQALWGLGDLSLAARWTVQQQDFMTPWIPQVQLIGGFRNALGRSAFDAQRDDGLDEFGLGVDEARLGVDVWLGMFAWKVGAATEVLWPFGRTTAAGQWLRTGPILRSMITAGYGRDSWGRVMASLLCDNQADVVLDGKRLINTGRTVYSVALAADAQVTDQATMRVSLARLAAFGSRNVNQATSLSLAYMHAW